MKKNPLPFSPDTRFEEALRIGQKNKISTFLVVENGKLIGIATESDTVRFLTHVLGIGEEGSRITIEEVTGKFGELQQVISIVDKNKTVILSMMSQQRADKKDWMIALHIKTREPEPIVINDLKNAGFNVTYLA